MNTEKAMTVISWYWIYKSMHKNSKWTDICIQKKTPASLAFILVSLCFCGNNFLTVVVIAIRTDSVRKLRLVALGAN